mmetsp:Transcript_36645/g.80167  ORF Transcript_36645/g.80167 Transcript_36645/m.80167 type:complete len:85 (-) Transcript_36645:3801-4055(-)
MMMPDGQFLLLIVDSDTRHYSTNCLLDLHACMFVVVCVRRSGIVELQYDRCLPSSISLTCHPLDMLHLSYSPFPKPGSTAFIQI